MGCKKHDAKRDCPESTPQNLIVSNLPNMGPLCRSCTVALGDESRPFRILMSFCTAAFLRFQLWLENLVGSLAKGRIGAVDG